MTCAYIEKIQLLRDREGEFGILTIHFSNHPFKLYAYSYGMCTVDSHKCIHVLVLIKLVCEYHTMIHNAPGELL